MTDLFDEFKAFAAVAILSFVAGFLVAGVMIAKQIGQEREQAIAAGVGRWAIDAATGEKKFVYGVKE